MDFEIPNKPKPIEVEKHSDTEIAEQTPAAENEEKIECHERQEVVDQAIFELKSAFQKLGIDKWKLPETSIKFVEFNDEAALGHVEVHDTGVEIVFDRRFASPESENSLVEEIHKSGIDYPGMQQTLKHELAHVAMWSVTGLQRQPATRLIDEGWASLLENIGKQLPIEQSKAVVRQGLAEEPSFFYRCLDFSKPVTFEEKLNAAEYKTGQALLLWIHQKFGKEKMISLIKKSPAPERRNDDLPEGEFELASVDRVLHTTASEYFKLFRDVKIDNIPKAEAEKRAKEWEGKQFETALLEVTRFQNLDEVRSDFLKWING